MQESDRQLGPHKETGGNGGNIESPEEIWSIKALDKLLSRYISVWLWSITLGATSGLSYAFSSSSFARSEWGPLALALAIGTMMGLVVTLLSWIHLLRYLRYFLIPDLLLRRDLSEDDRLEAARSLSAAFLYMVFGVTLSLGLVAMRLMFEAAQWGF